MAFCQIHFTPPIVYHGGTSQNDSSGIDVRNAPLIGSPNADHIVTLLFDYECPHCQQLHFMLNEAVRRCGGKLAFVLCPTPLNTHCNPYIPRDVDAFKDSCDLTKIALAVWAARREAFPAFDNWMFSLESGDRWEPRSLDAARTKAVELVGKQKFAAALNDSWIERYLQTSIRIYGTTVQGGNSVPKMIFGSRWVVPQPNDADDLISILHDNLGVPDAASGMN
jgi:protein-disulfide isomerase